VPVFAHCRLGIKSHPSAPRKILASADPKLEFAGRGQPKTGCFRGGTVKRVTPKRGPDGSPDKLLRSRSIPDEPRPNCRVFESDNFAAPAAYDRAAAQD
jgi:hypothetical protein